MPIAVVRQLEINEDYKRDWEFHLMLILSLAFVSSSIGSDLGFHSVHTNTKADRLCQVLMTGVLEQIIQ